MTETLIRALTDVLESAPGNTVSIPSIHRAVLARTGNGVSYGDIKATLRAAGVVCTGRTGSTETYAHGVTLTSELRNPRGSANNA